MGVDIDPKLRIAGYTPGVIKTALNRLEHSGSPTAMFDLAIFPHRRDGAIIHEECLSRGLINPDRTTLTEAGETFSCAKVVKRTSRAAAQAILDSFIANIHALNTSNDPLVYVKEIWLFGSLMRGEDTVGDIDIAMRHHINEPLQKRCGGLMPFIQAMLKRYPDAPQRFPHHLANYTWLKCRAIFGPRRHPLLSGARIEDDELIDIAAPCQLIYDRARGGRVDDPVIDRHPQAGVPSDNLKERRTTPDLTPGPLQPLHASWIANPHCEVSPCEIFRGWTDAARALFPKYPEHLRVLTRDSDRTSLHWTPKLIAIDGRHKTLLVNGANTSAFAVVLNRKIIATPTLWTIEASISDHESKNNRPVMKFDDVYEVAAAIALIVATDAEHMIRRAAEDISKPDVAIVIKENDDILINETLISRIFDHLESRAVMVEPPGFPSVHVAKVYRT